MAKEILKKSSLGAAEGAIRALLPELLQTLRSIEERLARLEARVDDKADDLKRSVDDKVDGLRRSVDDKVDGLRRSVDDKVDDIKNYVDTKFEQQRDLINELGLRINTVATRLEDYTEFTKLSSKQMTEWLERLVRLEVTSSTQQGSGRRRRAG